VIEKRRRAIIACAFLLTAHALLLGWSAASNSATFDEPAHLAAGVEYWRHGDFSIYSLSPPLLRLWAGLPDVVAGVVSPPTDKFQSVHIASRHSPYADWFISLNMPRFASLLLWARLGMIPVSCFAGWVTFLWARELYGWGSGLAACALYCFNPGFLANGALVTTDVGTAAAMAAACWLWWRFCRRPTVWAWGLVCVAVVAAHLCKFTAVLLWPMLLAMVIPLGPWRRRGTLVASWCVLGLATLFLLNAAYGFRGTGKAMGSFDFESQFMGHVQQKLPAWVPSLLPRTYLLGFDAQKRDSEVGYEGFIFGKIYRGTRWYFFPAALLCKTPLGVLALVVLALISLGSRRASAEEWSVLLAIAVFAAGVLLLGDLNIGTRYLLPMFPLGFVLVSRVWSPEEPPPQPSPGVPREGEKHRGRVFRRLASALLVVSAVEVLSLSPRFLTFMNLAVGGTSNGWRVLNNADFDWGQGLIDLRHWMRDNNVSTVQFAYFGFVDPKAYGVQSTPFIDRSDADLFAVSSYFLDGLQHRILVGTYHRQWIRLNFYKQLQEKKPIAVVGNTIFIYSRVDVESAVNEYFTGGGT
jgi:4-amino-4-deoxy-L-arabinose transferase-like glycosyltransferase